MLETKLIRAKLGSDSKDKSDISPSKVDFKFDYDDWPSTHNNQSEELRPFNENLFMLREHYKTVFPETEFNSIDEQNKDKEKEV